MGFFEKLKKKNGNTDVKTVTVNAQYNPYYRGYNNFSYPIDSKNKVSLRVWFTWVFSSLWVWYSL